MQNFFRELKDRKVINVGIAYIVGAFVVMEAADIVFPAIGLQESAIKLVVGLLAVGFPLALVLTWAFDITPEGIKRAEAVKSTETTQTGPSIAVVPFPDMSAEQDQEHFCDGLTEELLNVLTCIPDLRVASRTSSFSLKGKQIDLKEVATKFDVQHILEGSVRKAGNRIRVTAQLIEAKTDTHLWSETYDRELDDIFAIQDDIAACILAVLKLKLGPTRKASDDTSNAKAYEYFLRGRGYAMSKSARETELAAEMFKKATDLDPGFIRAWINLAEMCGVQAVFYQDEDSTRWQEMARQAGDRLMELSPSPAESILASAYALTAERKFAAAETAFKKVVELDSTMAIAYQYLARAQLHQGKLQAAAASFSAATECDPDDYESPLLAIPAFEEVGDHENALKHARIGVERAERVLEDYPDNQRAYYLGSSGFVALGQMDKALEWTEHALALNPKDQATRYNVACFYAKIGEIEKALDCLENSVTSRTWMENDPDLNALHDEPRYQALVNSLPT
jgi:adenylate cyclase